MIYDGKLLNRAAEELRHRSERHQRMLEAREADIEEKFPRIREIDIMLRRSVIQVIHTALNGGENASAGVQKQNELNLTLRAERAKILTDNGYPASFLNSDPMCPYCSDTGYTAKGMCSCLMDIYCGKVVKALEEEDGLIRHSFDEFDPKLFSDEVSGDSRLSPRDNIKYICSECLSLAKNPASYRNFFMCGGPGTGKTFMASCIAYKAAELGYRTIYREASTLLSRYEEDRFHRGETAQSEVEHFENCDLLIIDGLGSEIITSMSVSYLYKLLNTRISRRKSTIVISSLGIGDIRQRYSAQIASRLDGEFTPLNFFGGDIRRLIRKKN